MTTVVMTTGVITNNHNHDNHNNMSDNMSDMSGTCLCDESGDGDDV